MRWVGFCIMFVTDGVVDIGTARQIPGRTARFGGLGMVFLPELGVGKEVMCCDELILG